MAYYILRQWTKEDNKRPRCNECNEANGLGGSKCKKACLSGPQEVLFARYAGSEVMITRQECLIMNESDILAVIEE